VDAQAWHHQMIHRISAGTALELWPLVEDHARQAMEHHPFMDAPDLLHTILQGQAQLFIMTAEKAFIGFAAMEVLQYPSCRVANVLAAGGVRGCLSVFVKDLYPELEAWAREQDADTFAVHGRPGWMRVSKAIEGSKSRTYGVAWRRLDHERWRQSESDNAGQRTVGRRPAVPSGRHGAGWTTRKQ
jgi:hypothetical protein